MNKLSLVLAILVFMTGNVLACDCIPLPLENELKEVDHVFRGRVIAINLRSYPIAYEFEVLKTWKGKKRRKVTITSGIGSGDCGMAFINGHEYLVFAKRGKTTTCRRTAEIGYTQDEAILNWKYDKYFRKALKKSKPGPLTEEEAFYLSGLVMLHQDSIQGKKIAIFDASFPISKRDFFRTWGGHQVDVHYLALSPEEQDIYGVSGMLVAWTKGGIVDTEKQFLLEKLIDEPEKVTEEVLSRNNN
ncbi:MAG TPA: hypothetical protein ENK85_10895 [Saprospiraceae bacterium]|nr:hypothetical protein [Saprospiraceae bacterium]